MNIMPRDKPISIHEVAKKAGFSIATVSNVVNGKGRISQKTRKKVLAAVDELGYTPSSFGRQLRLRLTETVGLLFFPNCAQLFLNVYYVSIMAGVEEALDKNNYDLLLSSYERDYNPTEQAPKFIQRRKVDGVVLLGNFPKSTVEDLAKTGIPLLLLDSHMEGIQADSITTDGFSAGGMIANHLHDFGHKRLAFVGFDTDDTNALDRRRGFQSSVKDLGSDLTFSTIRVRRGGGDRFSAVVKALRQKNPPTALFVENDTLAYEVILDLKKNGFKVPRDVSVVGYDNSHSAIASDPLLTTVGVDHQALGRFGAEAIISRIQNPTSPVRSFRLPVTLFQRDSVSHPAE